MFFFRITHDSALNMCRICLPTEEKKPLIMPSSIGIERERAEKPLNEWVLYENTTWKCVIGDGDKTTHPHTLHIICTMWTLNTATSHTCSYDGETVETLRRKRTHKWASVMRAKVCECVHNIKNAVFGFSSVENGTSERQLIVCHAKYDLPSTCNIRTSCKIMWLGLLFTIAMADAVHFVVYINVAAHKWIKVLSCFYFATILPARLLSPAPYSSWHCASVPILFSTSSTSHISQEVTVKWGKSMLCNP